MLCWAKVTLEKITNTLITLKDVDEGCASGQQSDIYCFCLFAYLCLSCLHSFDKFVKDPSYKLTSVQFLRFSCGGRWLANMMNQKRWGQRSMCSDGTAFCPNKIHTERVQNKLWPKSPPSLGLIKKKKKKQNYVSFDRPPPAGIKPDTLYCLSIWQTTMSWS